jgi:hypothetical protein
MTYGGVENTSQLHWLVSTELESEATKWAPGSDKVETYFQVCHSLAYIPMNSPFLKAQGWDAEVTKMINVMGRQSMKPTSGRSRTI